MGFDLSRYSNQLASIHTVLKRLHGSGEADVSSGGKAASVYSWKGLGYLPFDIAAMLGLDGATESAPPAGRKRTPKKDDEGGER
jgi:hypothetical protein